MYEIETLGFEKFFIESADPVKLKQFQPARVISVSKNSFVVNNGAAEIFAELTGRFLFDAVSSEDFPAAGDWVYIESFDDNSFAVIHGLFPRRSLLKRKTAGKKNDYQLIAANIDYGLIMQSLDGNFNLRRLERYLVMVNEGGITPFVLLSKSDLLDPEKVAEKEEELKNNIPGISFLSFSSSNEGDILKIEGMLQTGKTYCLLGSSGVGKSTLLNRILHKEVIKTHPVREKDSRGKHTTTKRELVILQNGAMIIDTPGMRELGNIEAESGLEETFNEIALLAEGCKFRDCTHTNEEGCAVLKALKEGEILPERYRNYMKIHKESLYNEMSYIEKRQKDKKFGKFIHNYLKNKRDKR
jgi:ribosome biogenesis GTPase / thiamine phosphate phosphatase